MRNRTIKVAVVQAEVADSLEAGLELTRVKALEAARDGAELIVFPETWIPGYPAWLDSCRNAALWDHAPVKAVFGRIAENSLAVPGRGLDHLADTARQASATLVVGLSERVERGAGRGTLCNSLITIGPDGRLLNHHRKLRHQRRSCRRGSTGRGGGDPLHRQPTRAIAI